MNKLLFYSVVFSAFVFRLYAAPDNFMEENEVVIPDNFMEENEVVIIDKEQGIFAGDKHYISSDQLILSQEGLFVLLEGVPVPISCVIQDSQGIYCILPQCSSKIHDWECPRPDCRTWNGAWRMRCQRCGHDRPAGSIEN